MKKISAFAISALLLAAPAAWGKSNYYQGGSAAPSGAAGGDLGDTFPNPTVLKIGGAVPAAIATSGSANDLGSGTVPAARMPALSGDCVSSIGTVSLACASFFKTAGQGLGASGQTVSSNAVEHLSFQPGLLTSVVNTKAPFYLVSKASTVDNLLASAITFTTCTVNPVITMYECGTDASCASPTTIGSATITAAGQGFTGTVSNPAVGAGHYVAFALSAGTCAALDAQAGAQLHAN